ncbi:MAG: mmgC, partial [Acidobacteria bacterium]|nr:mmgC [Acidobacteriota bacterium]
MILELTQEQRDFQALAEAFAREHVAPVAASIDEHADFPLELVRHAGRMGLMGVTVPTEWGGAGRDYVSYALAVEALARASATVAVIATVNNSLVAEVLARFGTDEQ